MRAKRVNWVNGIHYEQIVPSEHDGMKYRLLCEMVHRGPHGLTKTMPQGRKSDGATYALDLDPEAFFTHDEFCRFPFWDEGTPISNWGASREYKKILERNGHKIRGPIRFYATFLFGGSRIKKVNGWFN